MALTCIISTILLSATVSGREIKPKYAQALCGDAFIRAWKLICKIKVLRGHRRGRPLSGRASSLYDATNLFYGVCDSNHAHPVYSPLIGYTLTANYCCQ